MKFAIIAEVAVIALAGLLTVSSTVNAATSKECWTLANTVKARLDSNPSASEEARTHYRTGSEACAKGMNTFGITHLEAAIKALGG